MSIQTRHIPTFLMGSPFNVDLDIRGTYNVTASFVWLGNAYRFSVSKWSGQGFSGFVAKFHAHCIRDPKLFGVWDMENGMREINTEQRLNCVFEATSDVFKTIDLICTHHRRSLLEYATWFITKARVDTSVYSDFITQIACEAIIETNLMAPNVIWEDIRFGR